jgi:PAS domain S-box-containing protein
MNEKEAADAGSFPTGELRQEAERRLRGKKAAPAEPLSKADALALVQELQVHQIELEMQNEELQRAQAAAQEMSEKYYELFDFAPVGYFLWDQQGRILELNLAGAALLGLNRNMAVQQRFGEFVAVEHRAAFAEFCRRVSLSDTLQICAVTMLSQGRSVYALVEGIAAQDHQGQARLCLAAVIDITQQKRADELAAANEALEAEIAARKRVEEALQQAKVAAEAANQAKSQFLANMSHELRTPMNAILGMIDVALPKAIDPTIQDCLQTAKGSADLLLTLLNDLLDSARIESGKLALESSPFSLRRVLDQVTRVLSLRASQKGLAFNCRFAEGTPDVVVGDRTRFEQVLLDLAGNAVKFTDRGEVEISLRALSQDGETCLECAVRDTGIGIPPASLEHLFQPFTQADASMARRFGGTGLGLSICKSLVEMMGGRIWVESEVGQGSTFHFTLCLPWTKELSSDFEAPLAAPAAACAPLRILLVEDNPANQKVASYILQGRGHRVEIAGDGQQAISVIAQHSYDVILMDVQMPGMDGLQTMAAIRKREAGRRRTPIIAMTAHATKSDRDRCLAAGMDGYLSKPVDTRELIGLVESLACGAAPVTQSVAATPSPAEASPRATALVFNPEKALSRCFDSADMVREMIQCFHGEVDNLFPQMRAALAKGDLEEVGRLGHRMKGSVVYLGAQPTEDAALRLVRFCQPNGGMPSEAEDAVNAVERECSALKAALIQHPLAAEPK